ncbi:MAG: hypothetical protein BWK79_04960 [Beggiatoa sp. IS2]|nr:MAG: hypothetical protein BWK79_04960 [Beggiatoa sp. IS2]
MSFEKSTPLAPTESPTPASELRRLGAILYDSLLLLAVLVFAAFIVQPWVDGQATVAYQLYLLSVSFIYFSWFWLHGGQTLGMLAWGIQLQPVDDSKLTLKHALLRFFAIMISWLILSLGFFWLIIDHQLIAAIVTWLIGIGGFLWSIVDRQRRNGYDWVSRTRMVRVLRKSSTITTV